MAVKQLNVEVAFALPHKQRIVALTVPEGTTARQAVSLADLPSLFQEVPSDTFTQAPLGIFGKAVSKPEDRVLEEGERVEIYRPLIADPKEVRKQRAAKAKAREDGGEPA